MFTNHRFSQCLFKPNNNNTDFCVLFVVIILLTYDYCAGCDKQETNQCGARCVTTCLQTARWWQCCRAAVETARPPPPHPAALHPFTSVPSCSTRTQQRPALVCSRTCLPPASCPPMPWLQSACPTPRPWRWLVSLFPSYGLRSPLLSFNRSQIPLLVCALQLVLLLIVL